MVFGTTYSRSVKTYSGGVIAGRDRAIDFYQISRPDRL